MPRLTGLLLAAGAGRRAGGPKALRVDADGTSWLVRSVWTLLDGGCDQVLVVLGAGAERARRLLPAELLASGQVVTLTAAAWSHGLSRSLLAGLAGLSELPPYPSGHAGTDDAADGLVVHLVDLPDVGADVVRRLSTVAVASRQRLARASYGGRPGHPVLIGADHVAPLRAELDEQAGARADVGARAYLHRHDLLLVECGDLATGQDRDLAD